MKAIDIERDTSPGRLEEMGVACWPIWEKDISEFPWRYNVDETCYILEGEVVVTPDGRKPVAISRGDLVSFPSGMSCRWKILKPIRKQYRFG